MGRKAHKTKRDRNDLTRKARRERKAREVHAVTYTVRTEYTEQDGKDFPLTMAELGIMRRVDRGRLVALKTERVEVKNGKIVKPRR